VKERKKEKEVHSLTPTDTNQVVTITGYPDQRLYSLNLLSCPAFCSLKESTFIQQLQQIDEKIVFEGIQDQLPQS
jgi:hypothetical protein